MSLARGRFGIEYNPRPARNGASGLSRIVALALGVVVVSLAVALVNRFRTRAAETPLAPPPAAEDGERPDDGPTEAPAPVPVPADFAEVYKTLPTRPPRVRTLLMRLREAQERGDLVTEVATLGQLRELPGNSALDLNNLLVRRLGELNMRWLFEHYNPQWVKSVKVKSGDSASRIALNHGATLGSFRRLNPEKDVDRLRVGDEVRVMDHPRFYLCVYPNTRKADLQLKGRLFKRYDLREAVTGKAGEYAPTGNLRTFLSEHGVWFSLADRRELEMLLPRKFTFVIGDL
ncbi:MAG: LysM peptidoglycan-binding domain-containing protein [Kiritimatiellia bacterium]